METETSMNFDQMHDQHVIEFADQILGVKEWMRMFGNKDHPHFGPVTDLWDQAAAELEDRGLFAEFREERGMDLD